MAMSGKERQAVYYKKNKDRINLERKMKYHKRLKLGLCPRCGEEPDDKDYKACSDCRTKHAQWWREWEARLSDGRA